MTLEKDRDNSEAPARYFIDLNWYREQERSFAVLTASRLCPSSREKEMPNSEVALLHTFKKCCSKWEGFITPNLPLLEMVFRLFLANGNQPLELEQIQEQLQQWLGDSSLRDLSIPKLKRIIDNDCYYGLRPVPPVKGVSTSPQSG